MTLPCTILHLLSLLFASASIITLAEEDKTVVVYTLLGRVKGLQVTEPETGDILNEFRGIRYGKPTSGLFRFRKPEPFGNWNGEYDGTKFSPACPQPILNVSGYKTPEMSEDCLSLNIYVPVGAKRNKKISVMVWIYGGALAFGHSHQYDCKRIAAEGNVIVVTINYRLSILGFFAFGNAPAKGNNYAVWDQKHALQWVHDNIGAFGDDPDSVTIFGESAGGWSGIVHALIPTNKGLFKRVIAQSGALDIGRMKMPTQDDLLEKARVIAEKTNCALEDREEFVNCLREKTTEELIEAANDFGNFYRGNQLSVKNFMPYIVVDHELFEENPLNLLKDPSSDVTEFFKSVDLIAGITSQEGAELISMVHILQEHYGINATEGIPCKVVCEALIDLYVKDYFDNDQHIKTKLCSSCNAQDTNENQSLKVLEIFGDIMAAMPTVRILDSHASLGAATWKYLFSKRSPISWAGPFPDWCKGAAHGDDMLFMFPSEPLLGADDVSFSDDEKYLTKKFIQYWTSFAKNGVPFAGEDAIEWRKFTVKERYYLDFDIPIKLKKNWAEERVTLWNEIYDYLDSKQKEKTIHSEL